MMDLRQQTTARLEALENLAQMAAETEGGAEWESTEGQVWAAPLSLVTDPGVDTTSDHIAAWDPAAIERLLAADRERLEEHSPCSDDTSDDPCGAHSARYECCPCHSPGPCAEQYRIAASLGIQAGA